MKNTNLFKIILGVAALSALAGLGMAVTGHGADAGPLFILFFLALAIGSKGNEVLSRFSFTIVIFAAVTTALYYPQYFLTIGTFKLTGLIKYLIMIIMFGMGTSMSVQDFAGIIKTPKGVFIGVTSHFIIMPLLGYTLAKLSHFPPEIAAGMILIGCSPNGLASNVISYLAKANLALSITITAVSTLLAPVLTPLLMGWLGGEFVEVKVFSMMIEILQMVIVPIGAGLIVNKVFADKSEWLDKTMPLVSMGGIAVIIVVITASGRNNLLTVGPLLMVLVLIHNLFGYTFGYWSGRLFKMDERDCRTMAIEVGMQNGGLASALANEMGKAATVGLAPAIFGPLMNITGSILASYWHKKPTGDPTVDNAKDASPEVEITTP